MLRNFVAKITNAIARIFQFILPCVFKKKVEAQPQLKAATSLSETDKSLAQIKTDLDAAKKDKEEAGKLLAQAKTDSASAAKSKIEADGIEAQAKQTQAEADKKLADAQGKLAEADAALLAAADPTAKVTLAEAQAERQAAADAMAEANALLKRTQDDVAQLRAKATEIVDKARRTGQEADEKLAEAGKQLEAANKAAAAAAKVSVTPPERHRPAALKPTGHAAAPSSGPTAPLPSDAPQGGHARAATQAPGSATEVKTELRSTRIASPERTAALVNAVRATSPERAASKATTATIGKTPARRWPSLEREAALKVAGQLKQSQGPEEAGAAPSADLGSYENTKFLVAMPDVLDYLLALKNVQDLDQSQLDHISEAAGKMFNDCKDDLPKIGRDQIHLKLIKDIEDWHFADEKIPMHTASLGINPKLVQEIIAFESGNPEKTGFIFIEGKLENDPKVYAAVYKQNSFVVVDFYQEGEARFASLSHNGLMKKFKTAGPEFRFIPVVKVEFPAAQVVDA
jgi:hypothetical protein